MSKRPVPETRTASLQALGPRLASRSGQLQGFLFGLAPDGVCHAPAITRGAVGFYPTFSPLPLTHRQQRRFFFCGTFREKAYWLFPRVYLPATGFGPALKVTRHRALWSSDFPPRTRAQGDSPPFQNRLHPTPPAGSWQASTFVRGRRGRQKRRTSSAKKNCRNELACSRAGIYVSPVDFNGNVNQTTSQNGFNTQIVQIQLPRLVGGVAQLVRALPCHGRGYGFEPRHSRHSSPLTCI